MSSPSPPIQWYLAREGKQFGPLSDAELARFIELGHLLPTDLLWREGFTEWRPAPSVFPPKAAQPAPKPMPPAPAAVRSAPAPAKAPAPMRTGGPAERSQPQLQPVRQQPRYDPRAHAATTQAARPAGVQLDRGPALQQAGAMPQRGPAQQQSFRAPAQAPPARQEPDYREFDDDADFEPGGTVLRRIVAVLLVVGALGAAVYFGYPYRHHLLGLVAGGGTGGPQQATILTDRKGLDVPPFAGLEGTAPEVDANLQKAAVWRVLKREFPDWYDARLTQIAELNAKKTDPTEVAQQIAQALVLLRRRELSNALSASIPQLKLVASTFFENLVQLRKTSDVACFEFIARGEASPLIVTMLKGSPQSPSLHAQMTAVYEAIADGRKTPRAYPSPKREDYEALATDLTTVRGWSQDDLQLFTNEQALAKAEPGKVCQLVHDWFAAQLAVKDPAMQVRLLVDSLKPVVAG